jgi:hypothetical protein
MKQSIYELLIDYMFKFKLIKVSTDFINIFNNNIVHNPLKPLLGMSRCWALGMIFCFYQSKNNKT